MKWTELLKFSAGNLFRRKLRTSLTLMGVIIGTASIVVMMSLGIGLNHSYIEQIESSGTLTRITVFSNSFFGGMPGEQSSDIKLDQPTIDTFSALSHVVETSPVYEFGVLARSGKYENHMYVTAMSYDMLMASKIPVVEGAMPNEGDPLMLIAGTNSEFNFYDPNGGSMYYGKGMEEQEAPVDLMAGPLFAIYDIDTYYQSMGDPAVQAPKKHLLSTAAIVGSADPMARFSEHDYSVYADLAAVEQLFQKLFGKKAWPNQQTDEKGKPITPMTYNRAYVLVDEIDNVTEVQQSITDMGFEAQSELDYLQAMQEQSRIIQYVLAGIGSVSLFVAAIGIANTMLMSIFERTKEIGVFKVLGCSLGNIRAMFLVEAGMIGFIGGILGLLLSMLISVTINQFIGEVSVIPLWLGTLGVSFAVLVGTVAGISPAFRATRLSPLEAIRML